MRYLLLTAILTSSVASAADWPTHRANAGRTAGTTDTLPDSPQLIWSWTPMYGPQPAWPGEPRMWFDTAFFPVIADAAVFVASNADDQLRALDAATGEQLWTFFADGPIRFAPAVASAKVYFGSDDGYVYCLDAASGVLVWKTLAAPRHDRVMGNGRMISRWPVRGGVAVRDGEVYAASGFWATDKVYLLALDAETGQILWRNSDAGEAKVVHKGETGAAFQGYLTVGRESIIVPNGRIGPSVYQRSGGKIVGTVERAGVGASSHNAFIDGFGYSTGQAYLPTDMQVVQGAGATGRFMGAGRFVAANEKLIVATDVRDADEIHGYTRDGQVHTVETKDRLGNAVTVRTIGSPSFHIRFPKKVTTALILTGDTIVASDGNTVFGLAIPEPGPGRKHAEIAWSQTVEGNALGLAVADGRLYVSTDSGTIYCFGTTHKAPVCRTVRKPSEARPAQPSIADDVVEAGGVTRGLCIDLDCGRGATAMELARRTDLRIYGFAKDAAQVASLRKTFAQAGLYGVRVTIHQGDAKDLAGLDGYADLVISSGGAKPEINMVRSLLSPYRGVACFGEPGALKVIRRASIPKAGQWTHFYADAGNTLCSNDEVARGPLQIRWYRDVVIPVPSRHGRAQPPLVTDGLMIIAGLDGVAVVNAFNGETIWTHDIPHLMRAYNNGYVPGGAAGGSVMCAGDGRFFVKAEKVCYVLDLATGAKLREISLPDGVDGPWGYVGYADGVLVGSVAYEGHAVHGYSKEFPVNRLLTESRTVFGVDAKTGKLLFRHKAEHFVKHMSIGLGGGAAYFIDRPLYEYETSEGAERHGEILGEAVRRGEDRSAAWSKLSATHAPGRLVSLDLRRGTLRWKTDANVRALMVLVSTKHNRVYTAAHSVYPMRHSGGTTTAYDTADGTALWTGGGGQRLWLNGDVLVAGGPVDAVTGVPAELPYDPAGAKRRAALGGRIRTSGGKHCGIGAYSRYLHTYRDGELGYTDSGPDGVRYIFGGVRSGCWTTNIPAHGLVLQSDSGYGCGCGYPIQASFALEPIPEPQR